jgi:hypothetical protein
MKQEIRGPRAALTTDDQALQKWAVLRQEKNDDPAFLQAVTEITCGLATVNRPAELYLIKVKNWFDHKWLRFSGHGLKNFELAAGVCIDEFFSDKTFPPFAPNRILEQKYTSCTGSKSTVISRVHSPHTNRSAANLNRRVLDHTDSGLFIWYSSNSKKNRRGSVMIITAQGGVVERWYASFLEDSRWQLGLVRGCDRDSVKTLLRAWPKPRAATEEPNRVR